MKSKNNFTKRLLSCWIVVALLLPFGWSGAVLPAQAAASSSIVSNFDDNFESYPIGHFTDTSKWPSTTEKASSGGYIEIVPDGSGKAVHLSLEYLSTSTSNDSYLQTKSYDFNGKFTMSFKFKSGSYSDGNMEFRFRDSQPSGNNVLSFAKVKGSTVTYLNSLYSSNAPSEALTPGQWYEVTITADIPNGTISAYRDGVLKAHIADYKTAVSGKYAPFVFSSCSIRTYLTVEGTVGKKSDVYLDDIKFCGNASLTEDYSIVPNGLYQQVGSTLYDITALKNGNLLIKLLVKNLAGSSVSSVVKASHYSGAVLKNQVTSPPYTLTQGIETEVSGQIDISELQSGDELRVVLCRVDGSQQTPISSEIIYTTSAFYRPLRAEIMEDLLENSPNNLHPRLMLTPSKLAQLRYDCKNTEPYKTWYAKVKSAADTEVNRGTSGYCSYDDTDDLRLSSAGTVLTRTFNLAFTYLIENNASYKTRLYGELNNSANWIDWNEKHFLDTSALCVAYGVAYDWLYSAWTPAEKAMIKNALITKGLNKAQEAYNGSSFDWWVTTENNWSMVCNGGIAVGALAIADEADATELCSEVLEKGLQSLEKCIGQFAPDGAWYEGPGYWHYTVQYLSMYFDSFKTALGTDYGYLSHQGISQTGYFPIAMTGMQNTFNIHDAGEGKINSAEQFFLAKHFNNKQLATYRYTQISQSGYSAGIKDILWFDPSMLDDFETIQKDFYYSDTEVATFRNSYFQSDSKYAAIHGGKNGINHGQIDAGNFVYDASGVRWAIDMGGDNYNLDQYFNNSNVEKSRWSYYRNRGEGHNTFILNPGNLADQPLDKTIRITEFDANEQMGRAVVDMAPLYPAHLNSATRTMEFDKVTGETVLTDRLDFKTTGNQFYWFMHTKAVITISNDGKSAILSQDGKLLKVSILDGANTFTKMSATPLPTSPNPNDWPTNQDNAGNSSNPKTQNANAGISKLAISNTNTETGLYEVKISLKLVEGLLWDDFESYPTGKFSDTTKWNIYHKDTQGGNVEIYNDGTKVLRTTATRPSGVTGTIDPYVESRYRNLSEKFVMSFKAKLTSNYQGTFQLTLRDDNPNSAVGTIGLFSLTSSKATYLPGFYDTASLVVSEKTPPSETVSNNVWAVITIEGDTANDLIRIYRDGVLKAEITNISTRLNGKFANPTTRFNFANCKVRLYTTVGGSSGNKIESRVDNFSLSKAEDAYVGYGDINDDRQIDVTDLVMAAEIAVGYQGYSQDQLFRANVSDKSDATVDISDVVYIAERLMGQHTLFPVEL